MNKPENNKDLIGKLIFLETTKNVYPNFGEYLIIGASDNCLYGVSYSSSVGYDQSNLKQLPLVGENPYNIVSISEISRIKLEEFVESLARFVAMKDTPGRRWVDSVYQGAEEIQRQVQKYLDSKEEMTVEISEESDSLTEELGDTTLKELYEEFKDLHGEAMANLAFQQFLAFLAIEEGELTLNYKADRDTGKASFTFKAKEISDDDFDAIFEILD